MAKYKAILPYNRSEDFKETGNFKEGWMKEEYEGYIPTYKRRNLINTLHESFEFCANQQISISLFSKCAQFQFFQN